MEYPFVSIIIPTWRHSKVLKQCVDSLLNLDYPADKVEIILLSKDKLTLGTNSRVQEVLIGPEVNYAHARNIGVARAKGELLAFVDDDATAPVSWLSRGVSYFQDENLALLGGPAVPPHGDSLRYRVGGYLLGSPLAAGSASFRYQGSGAAFETQGEHLIMANNLLRRDAFEDVDGLDKNHAPCEDGYLYFRLKRAGHKLMYAPDAFVWHRAKPVLWPIISKVFYYALGRGGLMARNPKTTRFMYLVPTLFVLGIVTLSVLSLFSPQFFAALVVMFALYGVVNLANALFVFFKFERNLLVALLAFLATPLLHISYGLGLLWGVYAFYSGRFEGGVPMWSKD